jgi:S-adenosylmethionine hydrolase
VVDPGVGTNRKSVVLKTKSGHFIVTPDNGTLTLVAKSLGIDTVRAIDETSNRRKHSEKSYTFHGRDVYAYTAARLASGKISFDGVGKQLPDVVVTIPFQQPFFENGKITGTVSILDIQYGNLWTNIPDSIFQKLVPGVGDLFQVRVFKNKLQQYSGRMPYANTFGAVAAGKPLLYLNSLMQVSLALNMENFSEKYKVYSGNEWVITLEKLKK